MFYKYLFTKEYANYLSNVKIISFSYTEYLNEPSIVHSHPYCEILIPLTNNGILFYLNKDIDIYRGKAYIVNPNISHTEKKANEQGPPFKYFIVKVDLSIDKMNEDDKELITIDLSKDYKDLINYLENSYQYLKENKNQTIGVLNLFLFYFSFQELLLSKGYQISTNHEEKIPSYVQAMEYYISKNYNKQINIKKLAESYFISHNQLTNKFKEATGQTPKEYILNTRIENAKYLLISCDYTVTQVSELCGFNNPAYFAYIFKSKTGVNPSAYSKIKELSNN